MELFLITRGLSSCSHMFVVHTQVVPSLEEMLERKKAEVKKQNKITFTTKAQREAAALERMAAKRKQIEAEREAARKQRMSFVRNSGDTERAREVRVRSDPREDREKGQQLLAIREAYLGKKKKKKKVVKPSEKFAKIFQFDWEATEDTSQDLNPLYQNRIRAQLAFGRGYFAGSDMREQRKQNDYMTSLVEFRQKKQREIERKQEMSRRDRSEAERKRRAELKRTKEQQQKVTTAMESKLTTARGKHWRDKELSEMTQRDWRILREDFDIRIQGGRAVYPLRSFDESRIDPRIQKAYARMGFKEPSPIQRQAIPIGLRWRDIIGIAETGSGKTAAFVTPMLQYIQNCPEYMRKRCDVDGPLAIIMAPTRELAEQIEEETRKIAHYMDDIRIVSVVGGASINDQGFRVRQGCDILIATPGRLLDCLENRYAVLNQCNYIVLDEADRMIDMGFEPQVEKVMSAMATLLKAEVEEEAAAQEEKAEKGEQFYRVTSFYSATFPPIVERLAKKYLRHPVVVRIGDQDSGKNRRITQHTFFLTPAQKKKKLLQVLEDFSRSNPMTETDPQRIIIFVNLKKGCDVLAKSLGKSGYYPIVLHGGKSQDARKYALAEFKAGTYNVLVATDVASRGLDIPDVKHIINFDMSVDIERYCHRIGRTARAGKTGIATTFITEDDKDTFYDLKQYLQSVGASIPHELSSHPHANTKPGDVVVKKRRDQKVFAR